MKLINYQNKNCKIIDDCGARDLKRLLQAVRPERLIPIHTFHTGTLFGLEPQRYTH